MATRHSAGTRILSLVLLAGMTLAHAFAFAASPGPSSRRTSWAISEIQFHPAARVDDLNLEFVEIQNTGLIEEDLGGHRLTGEIEYIVPAGTLVPAGGLVVIAAAPNDVREHYQIGQVLGGYSGRLDNQGGVVRLLNPAGAILLEATYAPDAPWPAGAAGSGFSQVLRRPSYGERDPRAWGLSAGPEGSPGSADPEPLVPIARIEECVVPGVTGTLGFVELRNTTRSPVALGGYQLFSPSRGLRRVIPPEVVVDVDGFLALTVEGGPEALLAGTGEDLLLLSPDGTRCLDAIRVGPQLSGVAYGRPPERSDAWLMLETPTAGALNARAQASPVVIDEILYHPLQDDPGGEFIELHHRGNSPTDLSGWRLIGGVSFEFPTGTRLEPGEYLVVARDAVQLRSRHPDLPARLVLGNFDGNLSNRGERVALALPPRLPSGATIPLAPERQWIVIHEVQYGTGGSWGRWSDGGGSSLELVDPRTDGRAGMEWADSNETASAPWTPVEVTGLLDLGVGSSDQLQVLAMGAGEYLLDDVSVTARTGGNRVANGTFASNANGWTSRGTQAGSAWDAANQALRVVAVARGDTGANRIETPLTSSLPAGETGTLKARMRWLRGDPELLLRLRGNALEAPVRLALPPTAGTPGKANSTGISNAAPTILEIQHAPILPASGASFVVTARVTDPDGVGAVVLQHRIDPSPVVTPRVMNDKGLDGDAIAGDGIYSVRIAGAASGTLHAFRVEATDGAPSPKVRSAPEEEALVRVGEITPIAGLATYRLWMTEATRTRWSTRAKLDNTPLPVTFVYNAERVIHGVGALYAGSPHISPGYSGPAGGLCGYVLHFPADEPFLGAQEVVLDWPGRDSTAQQEPMAYWIARELGIPFNHRRYIRLHVNGVTETIRGSVYEDAQQVNGDLMESWSPTAPGGDLFKIEQWFEFDNGLNVSHIGPPRLESYTTTGGARKIARYRWNWLKRASDSAHDYSSLMHLVDAANAPRTAAGGYPEALDAIADIEEWMRVFATENIVVNLDAWGYDIGKNMYAHSAPGGRWRLYMWDIDWVMLASGQHGYTPRSPLMYMGPAVFGDGNRDPVVGRMYSEPVFQRAYWRAIRDAVQGPLLPERVASRLNQTYSALVRAGVTRSSGQALTKPDAVRDWLAARRAFLLEQLATLDTPFAVTAVPPAISATASVVASGTAPIEVSRFRVNGALQPADWTAPTRWSMEIPLRSGWNTIVIESIDATGNVIPGMQGSFAVTYDGPDPNPAGAVVFNEWMAANASAVLDPADNDAEDWIELFNPGATAVDLSGWHLTDDPAVPERFTFPGGSRLEPRSFLLLWADGEPGQYLPGGSPHLPFRLERSGETLQLRTASGNLIAETSLGTATTDRSRGLTPDGSAVTPTDLVRPTPGAPNSEAYSTPKTPRILGFRQVAEGFLSLVWSSEIGARYQLQSSRTWPGVDWRNEGAAVTAFGGEAEITFGFSRAILGPRFYRVVRLP